MISEIVTFFLYAVSMVFLPEYFGALLHTWAPSHSLTLLTDLTFVLSLRFAWKVAVMVAISATPLYIIKAIHSRVAPAAYSKLL